MPRNSNNPNPRVHVAFGFHGNLYHSFRVDTNDEAGFGKDIRIIRKTISILDEFNQKGLPVKGVWDFENLFSLQETLPRYAPDIIENLQRRVNDHGDEAILMSYNNGLVSAFNEKEFLDSMRWAISNSQKSGIADIFGDYGKIVRPQEMMTSPGNFNLYKKLGIEAISLYYSSITFDTFKVFIPRLSMEAAHNPLLYENPETGESITVIPSYNVGDLIENISLRHWIRKLHKLQNRGEIQNDVLIYINFDADDEFWYGFDFPPHLAWLPNTGGLQQLIEDIRDLEYVNYTNLSDYLKNHSPVEKIFFGQDTADGSFNGYNSWSEKAYVHDYWTRLEHGRRNQRLQEEISEQFNLISPDTQQVAEKAYEARIRLLSTTNYGMATPYLAKARERVVEDLIEQVDSYSEEVLEQTFEAFRDSIDSGSSKSEEQNHLGQVLVTRDPLGADQGEGLFLKLPGSGNHENISKAVLKWGDNKEIPARVISSNSDELNLFVSSLSDLESGLYDLYNDHSENEKSSVTANTTILENESIRLEFSADHRIMGLWANGEKQLEQDSLLPMIKYKNRVIHLANPELTVINPGDNGAATIRLSGTFDIPLVDDTKPGFIDYYFTLVEKLPYLYVSGQIHYPETPRVDLIKSDKPSLARLVDKSWIEVAPLELNLSHRASRNKPFRVLKRNYLGVDSHYDIDYFRHSPQNLNLDNINQHITAEYLGVSNHENGFAIGIDTTVSSNFAFCPLKMKHEQKDQSFSLKLNPFGTYFGRQYYQPTWSNGQGFRAAFITGEQYASAGPTYNGHCNTFSIMLSFFKGDSLPTAQQNDLLNFAHPPYSRFLQEKAEPAKTDTPLQIPEGFFALYGDEGVYFHWEKVTGAETYKIKCGKKSGEFLADFETADTMLHSKSLGEEGPFVLGETYYAVIEAEGDDDCSSGQSPEIRFTAVAPPAKSGPGVPLRLQLKILFSSLRARLF